MKIKTAKLTGAALDWAVAECAGELYRADYYLHESTGAFMLEHGEVSVLYSPSTKWAQGGPILTRERISRTIDHSGLWIAYWTDGYTEGDEGKKWMQCDRSELVAGLRCFVASKLGEEVEVPNELI